MLKSLSIAALFGSLLVLTGCCGKKCCGKKCEVQEVVVAESNASTAIEPRSEASAPEAIKVEVVDKEIK